MQVATDRIEVPAGPEPTRCTSASPAPGWPSSVALIQSSKPPLVVPRRTLRAGRQLAAVSVSLRRRFSSVRDPVASRQRGVSNRHGRTLDAVPAPVQRHHSIRGGTVGTAGGTPVRIAYSGRLARCAFVIASWLCRLRRAPSVTPIFGRYASGTDYALPRGGEHGHRTRTLVCARSINADSFGRDGRS